MNKISKPWIRGIELTNHCSCHCKTCPHDTMTRQHGYIDEYTFKLAIDNVLKFSIGRLVTLHHFGDPILHPNLVKFINYAGSKGLEIKVSTIGNTLTPKLIGDLVGSKLKIIKFSFWGTNKREFENYQKASFNQTMENINRFIEKNKTTKIIIELLDDGSQNIRQLKHFKKWKNMLTKKRVGNWIGDNKDINKYTNAMKNKPSNKPCYKVWQAELKILWNGDVVPCCMDYDGKCIIGNIKEIWYGNKMNRLRELHQNRRRGEIELCKFCSYFGDYVIGLHKLAKKSILVKFLDK